MEKLPLNSLFIKGYRAFDLLTVEKLGRVNLIVGKNNVGKTALLEALRIYANHDESEILHKIVFARNEVTEPRNHSLESTKEYNLGLRSLFTNRPPAPDKNEKRRDNPYFIISSSGQKAHQFDQILVRYEEEREKSNFQLAFGEAVGLEVTFVRYGYDPSRGIPNPIYYPRESREIENLFISSAGLDNDQLVEFWDTVTLTELEDDVIEALTILLPQPSRIDFIGYPIGSKTRVPVVRVEGIKERVPLKSFGEGLTRILGISLALVQCQNGILLIDEIENGFHYSVLPDIWKVIFRTAKILNVQVFATTHSLDCVRAFEEAASEDKESEGITIRLERDEKNKIVAKVIDEELLELATKHNVEVR